MKRILLLVIIILSCTVLAEEQSREKIVHTNITVSGASWIGDDNQSYFNVTILTADQENNNEIKIGPNREFSNNQYDIRFVEWMSCLDTADNLLFNETVAQFHSCDGDNCAMQWQKCIEAKKRVEDAKVVLDSQVVVLKECNDNLTTCSTSLIDTEAQRSSTQYALNTCSTDKKAALDARPYYGGGGLLVGAFLMWFYRIKDRTKKSSEEKYLGERQIGPHSWDEPNWGKEPQPQPKGSGSKPFRWSP